MRESRPRLLSIIWMSIDEGINNDMRILIRNFDELSVYELQAIYKLRVSVFVVEQKCAYQEVDDLDKKATHIWIEDEGKILGYARVLPPDASFEVPAIGRVISTIRGIGIGKIIMEAAIKTATDLYHPSSIMVEAQTYAIGFYEKFGFVKCSDEFMDEGIPHVKMRLDIKGEQE